MIKTKQKEVIKSQCQRELYTLNMFTKYQQQKLRQKKKNEIKEESSFNYTTVYYFKYFLLPYFFYFSSDKFLNIHTNVFIFLSSNLRLLFLLQSQYKRGVGVYKVFRSNDVTLSFYSIYLCFILDLRRDNNKRNCASFKL